jgi:hypothetical protein
MNVAENLLTLQDQLAEKRYQPGAYASFTVHEPKRRLISAAPFRDRVVHHALCNVIEPLFERRFIHDSYANRVGKGTHRALDRCQYFARRDPYVLQCDVEQFFPAIDHALLLETIQRVIVDPDVLWLCEVILESGQGVLADEYEMRYFHGDDLFAANRPRGLPIGNLTSQFWANVYLDRLDHFVKRELKCCSYLRYVDDFLLFADNKATLWQWRQAIFDFSGGSAPHAARATLPAEAGQRGDTLSRLCRLSASSTVEATQGYTLSQASAHATRRISRRRSRTGPSDRIGARVGSPCRQRPNLRATQADVQQDATGTGTAQWITFMNESPIFTRTYDLQRWILERTRKFPREQRFVLARRLQDQVFALQDALNAAAIDTAKQRQRLIDADVALAGLRKTLLICLDMNLLDAGQYRHVSAMTTEVGKLLGGWRKQAGG